MKPSGQLIEFLNRTPLPWVRYDEAKQKLIVVIDNHMLSTYRNCPQHFFYSNVQGYQKKSGVKEGEKERAWYLDFGVLLHKMLEMYYQEFKNPDFDVTKWASIRAMAEWQEMSMDVHSEHKEFKVIGGAFGFAGLLMQYASVMSPLNEKIRVLGTEVSFGRNGEVPLYIGEDIEIYLAGRMDLIVDDGYFICPMDHKTMGAFRGDPGMQFETEEGPTGYIYALSKILPQFVPEDQLLKRDCSKILMNLIQKKPASTPQERFKRVPIRKTSEQLEAYRYRMLATVQHLILDTESFAASFPLWRNTTACTNWHMTTCAFRDVCRQGSREAEQATLNNGFLKLPIWDTETVQPTTF
jgi:hypothetical protein